MVRLIMGVKGSGKTKQLIELINNAAKDEPGTVAGRLWREEQHQVHRHHQRRPLPGYRRDAEVPVRLLRFPIYTDAASANWQRRRFSGFRFAPGRIRRPAPPADCNCHSPPQRTGR